MTYKIDQLPNNSCAFFWVGDSARETPIQFVKNESVLIPMFGGVNSGKVVNSFVRLFARTIDPVNGNVAIWSRLYFVLMTGTQKVIQIREHDLLSVNPRYPDTQTVLNLICQPKGLPSPIVIEVN